MEPNNLGQQMLKRNEKMNREGSRNNGKKLAIQNKLRILTTCVFSVFLYASETWTLKKTDKKQLLAFEMKCYRRILRISWKDMIRNEDKSERGNNHRHYKETKVKTISTHM